MFVYKTTYLSKFNLLGDVEAPNTFPGEPNVAEPPNVGVAPKVFWPPKAEGGVPKGPLNTKQQYTE